MIGLNEYTLGSFFLQQNRVGRWALTLNQDITLKHDDGLYYSTDYLIVHIESE